MKEFIRSKRCSFSNLQILEDRITCSLNQLDVVVSEFKNRTAGLPDPKFNLHVYAMFLQTHCNTACGFDEPGSFSGQTITECYTTIFIEETTDIFIVCFGNDPSYIVTAPNSQFYADIQNRCMKSCQDAKIAY